MERGDENLYEIFDNFLRIGGISVLREILLEARYIILAIFRLRQISFSLYRLCFQLL
jgi:hypothetical protein